MYELSQIMLLYKFPNEWIKIWCILHEPNIHNINHKHHRGKMLQEVIALNYITSRMSISEFLVLMCFFLTSAFGKTHSYEHKYACAYWHVDLVLPSFLYSELNTQHQDTQQLHIILWFSPVSTLGLHTYIYYAYVPFISSAYLSSRSTLKYANYSSQVLGFILLESCCQWLIYC